MLKKIEYKMYKDFFPALGRVITFHLPVSPGKWKNNLSLCALCLCGKLVYFCDHRLTYLNRSINVH